MDRYTFRYNRGLGPQSAPPPALDGVIQTEYERTPRSKGVN